MALVDLTPPPLPIPLLHRAATLSLPLPRAKTTSFRLRHDGVCNARVCSFGLGLRKKRLLLSCKVTGTDVKVSDSRNRSAFVDIPVTCYQILGVPDISEKDEIVKSVMHLKNVEIEEGYSTNAIVSRQNLLMDARDKLLFEPEYAGNLKEKVPPKSSLHIPWAWLPGALCLLQEVGENKIVLDIGITALQHPDAKPYVRDLLLSMALAECSIAKARFEKNNVSQGYEALARAQCILRSEASLGKMVLLSQIEESLETLAPACTLELLGMTHTPENAERRVGAVSALHELLRQGLDVEASCQVQDWPSFLYQALNKLTSTEIVELLPWDNLAATRKNKKSLESQNQRVVVDLNCFYMVLMAHIALGFAGKQTDMINKAKTISECLVASDGADLKLEEAFCLFLLGQGDQNVVAERLQQVELNLNSTSRSLISAKDIRDTSDSKKSLEAWLKSAALDLFPDTRNCSPSLDAFFSGIKKVSENKLRNRAPLSSSSIASHRPLSTGFTSDRRVFESSSSAASQYLGPAVKQLTPSNLQSPRIASDDMSENNFSTQDVQLKRNLGNGWNRVWEVWWAPSNMIGYLSLIVALVCTMFATSKLLGVRFFYRPSTRGSLACATDSSPLGLWRFACDKGNSVASGLKKLLSIPEMQLSRHCAEATLSSSMIATSKRPMPTEEAESLVKQWQAIKAEAVGPNHQIHGLHDVLDESMLVQWQALAEAAKARACFWRFVLLQLSVLKAEISSDATGKEMAEIDVLLEEAAELVDASLPKNPNYYSIYTIRYILRRQGNDLWRFCEADVQTPS